ELLADDAVIGKARRDQPPHRRLGTAVGGRHRRQVGLVVDLERYAEIGADRLPGGVGKVGGERQVGVELAHCPPYFRLSRKAMTSARSCALGGRQRSSWCPDRKSTRL